MDKEEKALGKDSHICKDIDDWFFYKDALERPKEEPETIDPNAE